MSARNYIRRDGTRLQGYQLPTVTTETLSGCAGQCDSIDNCIGYSYNKKTKDCTPVTGLANISYDYNHTSGYLDSIYDPMAITVGNDTSTAGENFTLQCQTGFYPTDLSVTADNGNITGIGMKCGTIKTPGNINNLQIPNPVPQYYRSNLGVYGDSNATNAPINSSGNLGFTGLVVAGNPNGVSGIGFMDTKKNYNKYGQGSSSISESWCPNRSIITGIKGTTDGSKITRISGVQCMPDEQLYNELANQYITANEMINWQSCPSQTSIWF